MVTCVVVEPLSSVGDWTFLVSFFIVASASFLLTIVCMLSVFTIRLESVFSFGAVWVNNCFPTSSLMLVYSNELFSLTTPMLPSLSLTKITFHPY